MRPVFASDDYLAHRAHAVRRSHDLTAIAERLARLARPLIDRPLMLPSEKAQLSQDGGICPVDGGPLAFDPWRPDAHACPRCGGVYSGKRHYERWLMWYHVWLSERALHLALLGTLRDEPAATARAVEIVSEYADRYLHFPNRDCVLGPSRLFFSTYLESVWLTTFVGAADVLRIRGQLDPKLTAAVDRTTRAAAELIAEFDEGLSNRQTWHHTALLAAATYLDEGAAVTRALEGLVDHLTRGVGADGMWHEGENYHFFAQRALLLGAMVSGWHGLDLFHAAPVGERLGTTFDAVLHTVQPDLTFPARRDAQYGISLHQPRFAAAWEMAVPHLRSPRHLSFLRFLYGSTLSEGAFSGEIKILPEAPDHGASDVSEIEYHWPAGRFGRDRLSWKGLLWAAPELAEAPAGLWRPPSRLLEAQGVAVLRRRRDSSYVSLEFGHPGGGHGHPDRLHLTLHERGRPWLTDFGTGSYVRPDLFWYRSTLAHNAPLVDGRSQLPAEGECTAFGESGDWAWCSAELPLGTATPGAALTRVVFRGPDYLFDVVTLEADHEAWLLVPWHVLVPPSDADWEPASPPAAFGGSEFVHDVRRCPRPGSAIEGTEGAWSLAIDADAPFEVYSAAAPGPPYSGDLRFVAIVTRGRRVRIGAGFTIAPREPVAVARTDGWWGVTRADGERHRLVPQACGDWVIDTADSAIAVKAIPVPLRIAAPAPQPRAIRELSIGAARPDLPSFALETPADYRRAEGPYPGRDRFSAAGRLWWTPRGVHLSLEVVKPAVVPRPDDAPDPRLDNEAPDIHADGVQLYVRWPGMAPSGYVLVLDPARAALSARPVAGMATRADEVCGVWERTSAGYRVEVECRAPEPLAAGMEMGFDCLVNEMWPDRRRRAGQLVLSGGGDWVWLAGDRQPPERFARLALS